MVAIETIVSQLLTKLADPLISLYEVDDEVKLLDIQFRGMQCFLKDADAKQEGNEGVKNWVLNVRDAAYEAEDVIDNFIFKLAPLMRTGFMGCITRYACIFCELIARYKLSSDIKRINNKIDVISKNRSDLGIQDISQETAGTSSGGPSLQEWRLTSPLSQEPDFVGFEKELEMLVGLLTKGELRRCVVSVVGMGGLGKTTLTKKVYNDTRVKARFQDFCAWICLSQEYDVKDVLKKIINGNMKLSEEESKKVEKMDVFELRHKISEYLKGKIYLMVVDDIWTNEAWDAIKGAFPLNDTLPDVENGSRVMITTRNKVVALHADAQSLPYELLTLGKDESWNLFCRKAFPGQGNVCPDNLEQFGRKIVEECCGLPLAIVVIGGLLSTKEEWEWENVRESITWQITEGQDKISKILSLSFRDLPYQLKPCFLYLGIFPEDYEFPAKKLIQLWAAEGFLQQRGNETVEKVGEDFLKELIQRSIVQLAKRNSKGGVKSCRIHDLLRDLSVSKAKEGMFLQVHNGNSNTPASRARRLVIHHNALRQSTSLNSSTPHFRSVLIHNQGNDMLETKQEKLLYKGFKLLRVLDLHNVQIKQLSSEIGALIHLKYLGCTNTWLKSLPSSIGKLLNLQTLVVTSHFEVNIPREIEKMKQLRYFQVMYPSQGHYYNGCGFIQGRPRLNQMSNLHTLTLVFAGEWMHGCLESLTHLRKLGIRLDYITQGVNCAVLFESISKLKCLQSLLVTVERGYVGVPETSVRPLSPLPTLRKLVLDGLLGNLPEPSEFLTNLTKLTLKWSDLNQDPLATLEKLENLRVLRLLKDSYVGVKMACTSKGFPRLESLHLEELEELNEWTVEEGALPSLLHLQINSCRRLRMLPVGLQHVTTLKKLELLNMRPEFNERLQEDEGEDWNKIRHILSIDISERKR